MISKPIYTTLSEYVAKPGYTFQFLGEAKLCRSCPKLKVCLGRLEVNEIYFVTEVRKNKFICPLIEESAVVVQVKPSLRKLVVSSGSAVIGTSVRVKGVDGVPCSNNCLCFPNYIKEGKQYIVRRVIKKTYDCPFYSSRSLVEVEPV